MSSETLGASGHGSARGVLSGLLAVELVALPLQLDEIDIESFLSGRTAAGEKLLGVAHA